MTAEKKVEDRVQTEQFCVEHKMFGKNILTCDVHVGLDGFMNLLIMRVNLIMMI